MKSGYNCVKRGYIWCEEWLYLALHTVLRVVVVLSQTIATTCNQAINIMMGLHLYLYMFVLISLPLSLLSSPSPSPSPLSSHSPPLSFPFPSPPSPSSLPLSASLLSFLQSSPKHDPDEGVQTDRQLLHDQWSHWTNWYKQQPLGHVR